MQSPKILIFGASGLIGSELVRILTARGLSVRTTTSKEPKSLGANIEQVKVTLSGSTSEGLKEAFKGIEKVFLLSPGGIADQYSVLSPLIQEAKRNGLKKVVLMTAMGANADEASPMRKAEVELEKSGLSYNIIRPNWFMQNFHTFWVQGIREQGKILLPAGKAKVSFIDTRDISEVAAKLLTSDQWNNQAFEVTGSEALDHDQVAKAISEATGKTISYQEIEPKVLKQGLLKVGLPEDYSDFLLHILSFLAQGYSAPVSSSVQTLLGRAPRSLATYTQEYKKSFM